MGQGNEKKKKKTLIQLQSITCNLSIRRGQRPIYPLGSPCQISDS